ncbi:lipin Ned1 [Coemansia erecta]|uniref:phosphatidate phosphatase n=1 Tax=Coemansia erecta TaxID=147472 RepID=A0A9W8CNU5_9FUNG|nr:lipin Ned1 [Coemansia erecta]
MQYVGKVFSTVSQLYKELNPATLSGAIDVVVVEDRDGNFSCSPFHVRFGKLQLLRPSDKTVQVIVNDKPAEFYMKVSDSGEAFFVLETESDVPSQFMTSPVASPALSFRMDDDPDFLDLSGNIAAADGLSKDGYVSAHGSEHESGSGSESGSESDSERGSEPELEPMTAVSNIDIDIDGSGNGDDHAHSDTEAPGTSWHARSSASIGPGASGIMFNDDMAMLSSRQSERILHQLGDGPVDSDLLAAAAAAAASMSEAGGSSATRQRSSSTYAGGGFQRRPMSIASDSAPFSHARRTSESHAEPGAATDSERDSHQLHSEWDWGVKITPPAQPAADTTTVDTTAADTTAADTTAADTTVASAQPKEHILDVTSLLASAASSSSSSSSPPDPVLQISLCGIEALQTAVDSTLQQRIFDSARVRAETFATDPIGITTNPNLVFLQNSEYVQGEALVLALVSQLAYGQPLDSCLRRQQNTVEGSVAHAVVTMPSLVGQQHQLQQLRVSGSAAVSPPDGPAEPADGKTLDLISANDRAVVGDTVAAGGSTPSKPEGRRWWRWGQRNGAASTAAPSTQTSTVTATASKAAAAATATATTTVSADTAATADAVSINMPPLSDAEDVATGGGADLSGDELGVGYMSEDGSLPHPLRRQNPLRYAKTLRLTSDQLRSLSLKRGANDIKFLVPSNKAYCEAKLYLYRYDTQIVISDIDGTITKSDALGHLFNMVGKDWTHHGVAKLYTDIANNGYEILYLTSRAIGQADGTRDFLTHVKQGEYRLPGGPLLLSPDRLFTSFHREVIMKRPQEFKMACLRDIKNLFGDQSPFYAGFGNRITDAMSYRSVNVPVSRICTIDTYGEIKLDLLPGYKSSYVKINDLVDMMFPALSSKLDPKFNDWEYWKPSLPQIDDELAEIDAMLALEANKSAAKSPVAAPSPQKKAPSQDAVAVIAMRHRADSWASAVRGSSPPPLSKPGQDNHAMLPSVPRPNSVSFSSDIATAPSLATPAQAGVRDSGNNGYEEKEEEDDDDDDDEGSIMDSSIVAAASRLVPQIHTRRRTQSEHSTVADTDDINTGHSDESDYSEDNQEGDDEDEDEDEDISDIDEEDDQIDQEMLDIMHDMEQLQRLQ